VVEAFGEIVDPLTLFHEIAQRAVEPLAIFISLEGFSYASERSMQSAGRNCFKNLWRPVHKNLCFREHRV
jgi:hypothetical protein